MTKPSLAFDLKYSPIVIGLDEVGYGPWAGPVITAAVSFGSMTSAQQFDGRLNDSKLLSPKKRTALFIELTGHPDVIWAVGESTVEEIDHYNIRQATLLAMSRALKAADFSTTATLLVDGTLPLHDTRSVTSVVKGDRHSLAISAASIIAKVTRDAIMVNLHDDYPSYDWNNNVGYGTPRHQEGLRTTGISPHHRRSYAPIARLLSGQAL